MKMTRSEAKANLFYRFTAPKLAAGISSSGYSPKYDHWYDHISSIFSPKMSQKLVNPYSNR